MNLETLRTIYSELGALKQYSFACSSHPKLTNEMRQSIKDKVAIITKLSNPIRNREITDAFISFRSANGFLQSENAKTSHGSRLMTLGSSCQSMQKLIANYAESLKEA